MRAVCSVERKFKRVEFFRLTGLTRPLPVRVPAVQYAGQEARSWFDERDEWLLDTAAKVDKWVNDYSTDPMPEGRKRIVTKPLVLKVCDCWLARGEECCCT